MMVGGEEAATAAKQAVADGLPALTGSEKQIRWAESIRKEKMAAAREWLVRYPGEEADKCLAWYGFQSTRCTIITFPSPRRFLDGADLLIFSRLIRIKMA